MIKIITNSKDVPNDILDSGDWIDWEYLIIPNSYKEIEKAKNVALSLADMDYKKFKTKNENIFFITYHG